MATFVLIPGAGADPRVYTATIAELRARGHHAVAPPLPLSDPQAAPTDHAEAIVSGVPAAADDLVVVAQSLGTYAGSIAAEPLGARSIILIAPMLPAPGESAGEWWDATDHARAIADVIERHGPMSEWNRTALEDVFLHDVDPAVARANEQYEGAPGPGMFGEPWPLHAWPSIPTHVLIPRGDRLFPLAFQRRLARERLGIEIDEMAGGHVPMLSRPAELAERLIELAR